MDSLPRKALFDDRFVLAADRDNPVLAHIRGLDDGADAERDSETIDMELMTRLPFVAMAGEMPPLLTCGCGNRA